MEHIKQSLEPPPAPEPKRVFDTTTPAETTVHRFTLNDLPRYADKLYPHLKERFPHLHERMYGSWLRSCITDNATFFVCGNATVAMAKMVHDPLDPRPMVDVVFCLGDESEFVPIYKEMLRWAKDLGAPEMRAFNADHIARLLKLPNIEKRRMVVFKL